MSVQQTLVVDTRPAVPVLPVQESGPSVRVVLDAVGQAVDGYCRVFGERLCEVWLHGSRATGRYAADSDVDLLAVLHAEGGRLADLKLMGRVNHPMWHTHGLTIDGHATSVDEFYNGADPFGHDARTEGIRVDEGHLHGQQPQRTIDIGCALGAGAFDTHRELLVTSRSLRGITTSVPERLSASSLYACCTESSDSEPSARSTTRPTLPTLSLTD